VLKGASAAGTRRRATGAILAVAACATLALCDEAAAASLRGPASALGALALAAPLLLLREWPGHASGSWWVMGTLLAAAVWLCRTQPLPAWFPRSPAAFTRLGRLRIEGWLRIETPTEPTAPQDDAGAALDAARRCFLELQAAWDVRDVAVLRARTTTPMFEELEAELVRRGPGPDRTDVVTLHAELIGLERDGSREVASVAFSGMIRESADAGAAPFREVWMLVRDANADWRLARHQALM
jgi:hypothetical protein